ncbi:CBS domain-containing protein [Bacillus daqingensis]|uniref:CBS domain-containing protein n=1 Tax=Bacillus daqingensis TaxID=872396 RepID=A0ABV9P0J4_9BACI
MQLIMSHNNLDFDALASLIAAKKLYPEAEPVLPSRLTSEVEHFITIYKDIFPFIKIHEVDWSRVKELILVDASYLDRQAGEGADALPVTIIDHHTNEKAAFTNVQSVQNEAVGACVTLLAEHIHARSIPISPLEATVFALGLYSDTDSFTIPGTTARDLEAGAYFLRAGANLKVVDQFRETPLSTDQQRLFQELLENGEQHTIDGIDIMLSASDQDYYTGHLAHICKKLLQVTGLDGVIVVCGMGNKTFITTRGQSEQVDFRALVDHFGGGGHAQAASASVKGMSAAEAAEKIKSKLAEAVVPALTASDLMSSPVRVIAPETTVETAVKMIYRYGHSGFPIVEDDRLTGIISRRDLDKALHHGLGHAPVKGFMQRNPVWIDGSVRLDQIRTTMMEKQIGRLPVLQDGRPVGIVSRSDIIQAMHGRQPSSSSIRSGGPVKRQVAKTMEKQFPPELLTIISSIQKLADEQRIPVFIIGGIVRDLFLNIPNEDLDIVLEGDAPSFGASLAEAYGGRLKVHEAFRTATWTTVEGSKVDLTSARTEYYDFPAALPRVELSTIREDLYRRDFTINTLAVQINRSRYGELTDYFNGLEDLTNRKLRILYNLSFVEDPTRILRAVRFETRFMFQMEAQTKYLAEENKELLASVSHFRLSEELYRLFTQSEPLKGLERLFSFQLQKILLSAPEEPAVVRRRQRRMNRYRRIFQQQGVAFPEAAWMATMLFMTSSSSSSVQNVRSYAMNRQEEKACDAWLSLWSYTEGKRMPYRDAHAAASHIPDWAAVAFAAFSEEPSLARYVWRRLDARHALKGKDLIEAGFHPGPVFSDMLFEAEMRKLENPSLTKEELLAPFIKAGHASM